MAKYREVPCINYICHGQCKLKKKDAVQSGRCQICSKYQPRAKVHLINRKKQYNQTARKMD